MNVKYLRPIPNYIAKKIRKIDEQTFQDGNSRFYAYFAKMKDELVKITVACKSYKSQWFCKQVAIHGVHSEKCYVKDIEYGNRRRVRAKICIIFRAIYDMRNSVATVS